MVGESTESVPLDQRFEAARSGIIGRRLNDLSSEQLETVENHLQVEGEELVAELEGVRGRGDEALSEGKWSEFDVLRGRAIEVSTRYEELRELSRTVSNTRQERILEEQLESKLGSRGRVVAYDLGIMLLIVLVVSLLLAQELTQLEERTIIIFDIIDVAACGLFLTDFFWRMRLAESRRWFWKRYWLDFITSIPLPASLLRVGRVVRLARLTRVMRLVRLLRIVRTVLFFWRGMDKLTAALDVKMMRRSLKILVTVLVLGAFGMFYAEGAPDAEGVEDLGQSVWWSFTTVVTGGFGDIRNPTTWEGRLLTTALIIAGMVVVGIFTATLTSVLVREEDTTAAVLRLEEDVNKQLGEIQSALADMRAR